MRKPLCLTLTILVASSLALAASPALATETPVAPWPQTAGPSTNSPTSPPPTPTLITSPTLTPVAATPQPSVTASLSPSPVTSSTSASPPPGQTTQVVQPPTPQPSSTSTDPAIGAESEKSAKPISPIDPVADGGTAGLTPAPNSGVAAAAQADPETVPAVSFTETKDVKTGKRNLERDYRLPVLTAVSNKAARALTIRVNRIVAAAEKTATKAKVCKKTSKTAKYPNATLKITADGAVIDDRYASVRFVIEQGRPYCEYLDYGRVESVTVDLKTAKVMKLNDLRKTNGQQFDAVIAKSLKRNNPDCAKNKNLKKVLPPLRTPDAWTLTANGIDVWYDGSAQLQGCVVIHGFAAWKNILKPAEIKGKKAKTSYWVKGLSKAPMSRYGYKGKVAVVRQTGTQVVVFQRDLDTGTNRCQVGLRADKKAITWRAGKPWSKVTYKLTSTKANSVPTAIKKDYRKASSSEISELFKESNALGTKSINKACRL